MASLLFLPFTAKRINFSHRLTPLVYKPAAANEAEKVRELACYTSPRSHSIFTMAPRLKEISVLLENWSQGNSLARDELMPLVYDELRRLARHYMAQERAGHSLQATALVNEAYLRLVDQRQVRWQGRAHFFALASQMMRRILVDHARRRRYAKRGGGAQQVSLDEAMIVTGKKDADLVALDDALTRLEAIAPRKSQVVELRYFGGLSLDEIAEVLKVSEITVRRDWTTAKAWLYRAIAE